MTGGGVSGLRGPGSNLRHTDEEVSRWRWILVGGAQAQLQVLGGLIPTAADAVDVALVAVGVGGGAKDPIYKVMDKILDEVANNGIYHSHHDQRCHQ